MRFCRPALTGAGVPVIIMLYGISQYIIKKGDRMAEQGPMTEAMYYILLSLLRPGHGYGMMQRIKELSGGRLEMGPGTLYGVLSRMSREGMIAFTGEEGRRKNYAITPAGREALLAEYNRLKQMVADGGILEVEV
jgi:DNA-binding PadR family transcriptional regulator